VDRLTRHQLKQDEFRLTFEHFQDYFKQHYKQAINIAIVVMVVVGLAGGLKYYMDKQEAEANTGLGAALDTFHAYVGTPAPGTVTPGMLYFATPEEKYRKALQEFSAIADKYHSFPKPKAAGIALYHVGICQALLGNSEAAIRVLEEASRDRHKEIAALAKFALAGELAKTGKIQEAAKIYQDLADRPTLSVPRATALMALAETYRISRPAQARQLYQQLEKEFASDATLAQTIKQQMADLSE
jgi:tetratricopeptide (TPR) repeat protein